MTTNLSNENVDDIAILQSLIVSGHRLTRIAAQGTGSRTPASVWRTLSILRTDGAMRVGALAASSRISQPGMTKLLPQLIEDELVYRIADVADSRAWLIAISDKGRRALELWRAELALSLQPLFTELTDAQWATLAEAADILTDRVATDLAGTASTGNEEAA